MDDWKGVAEFQNKIHLISPMHYYKSTANMALFIARYI